MNRDLGVWTSDDCALVLIDWVRKRNLWPDATRDPRRVA